MSDDTHDLKWAIARAYQMEADACAEDTATSRNDAKAITMLLECIEGRPPPGVETEGVMREALVKIRDGDFNGVVDWVSRGDYQTVAERMQEIALEALLSTSSRGEDLSSRGLTRASLPASGGIPSEWQPIESAPRDQTSFLAWMGEGEHVIANWEPHAESGHGGFVSSGDGLGFSPFYLTHWMPLPSAPVGSQASE